jgi:predicted ATPase
MSGSMPKKVVITGGPGTGKTSVISALEAADYVCFHEIIRSMTLEAKKSISADALRSNPIDFVSDPMAFNLQLLKGRVAQFKSSSRLPQSPVFFDRGIPDVLAYMTYFGQAVGAKYFAACKENRYDEIILLPPWEAIYVSDNERMESFDEAIDIHYQLQATYEMFGYHPIIVPEGSVSIRTSWILEKLNQLL